MSDRKSVMLMMFDLPMATSAQRRHYSRFMKQLKNSGYRQLQKSVYVKLLHHGGLIQTEVRFLRSIAPGSSKVNMLPMTLEEFRQMQSTQPAAFDISYFSDDILYL